MMLDTLEKLLTWDEGKQLKPYKDSRGIDTIGIGHNLVANGLPVGLLPPDVPVTYPECMEYLNEHGLTDAQCDALFHYDITHVAGFLTDYPWFKGLDIVRQAALQDMAFNMGERTFKTFAQFTALVGAHRFSDAAADLRRTAVYSELSVRYGRIARMLETGLWPA
jgi:lysozyme